MNKFFFTHRNFFPVREKRKSRENENGKERQVKEDNKYKREVYNKSQGDYLMQIMKRDGKKKLNESL